MNYDLRNEIYGSVHDQIIGAAAFITQELGTELVVIGMRRHQLARLPEVVVREAIANAVAHRSYEMAGSAVRVEMQPDMVVIKSPGGLIEPVTVENIRDQQAARNPDLISVLRRLGLAEDAGRGVDVMEDTMATELLDPPTFEDDGNSVTVRLPIRSAVSPAERAWIKELYDRGDIEPTDRLLLVYAARGEALTNKKVRELLHVDSTEARQALNRLRDLGYLRRRGQRGGTYYVVAQSLNPPAGLHLSEDELLELIEDMANEQPVTNQAVRQRTGLDANEAFTLLSKLVANGRLLRLGEKRGTHYVAPMR